MEYKYKCLCCGNKENLIFGSFSKKSSMSYPKAFDDLDIITCPECQFSFTNKPVSKKILNFYYENLYTGKSIKSNVWNPSYQRSRFQYSERSLAQVSLISQFFSWDKKNIIEIGSATGELQIDIANRGYNINSFIVEPQTINSDWFSRNNITPIKADVTDLQGFSGHENKYDLAIMSHSLEHFNAESIDNIFLNMHSILNSDGIFFIEVPNANLFLYDGDVERMAPHLSFFSQKSLSIYMKKYGFDVLYIGLFGNSQIENQKNQDQSNSSEFNEFCLDESGQVKINIKTQAFNEKRSIKHSLFYFLSNFLVKVGMRTLILKIKTFRSITDKKFLTFNNRDMTLNSVDGEFLRIIGKKRN